MEPDRRPGVQDPMRRLNWTTIALIGGLVLLLLVIAYFATRGNSDQDKLTNANLSTSAVPSSEKLCAGKATYDLIKRDLFRRAAQIRGSDEAAFDQISGAAVLRMENPVMESEDNSTRAVHCSGSVSLDLPPGVALVGGRHTLSADVDYSVQQAVDGSGRIVLVSNADAIITPLATMTRVSEPAPQSPEELNLMAPEPERPSNPTATPPLAAQVQPGEPAPATPRTAGSRSSFDCAAVRGRSEIAICSNAGLAALDRNMTEEYRRALSVATPDQRAILLQTRDRFARYRDRCLNNACISEAYAGRIREIRDIVEGRWQPPR